MNDFLLPIKIHSAPIIIGGIYFIKTKDKGILKSIVGILTLITALGVYRLGFFGTYTVTEIVFSSKTIQEKTEIIQWAILPVLAPMTLLWIALIIRLSKTVIDRAKN